MSISSGSNIICHECRMPLGVVNLCDNQWHGYVEVLCFRCIAENPTLLIYEKISKDTNKKIVNEKDGDLPVDGFYGDKAICTDCGASRKGEEYIGGNPYRCRKCKEG